MSPVPTLLSLFAEDLKKLHTQIPTEPGKLIRLSKSLGNSFSILDRIKESGSPERFYFKSKEATFELGGIGEGVLIAGKSEEKISTQLDMVWKKDPHIRFFGGMRFESSASSGKEWAPFGNYRFIVPFVEFCRIDETVQVTLTFRLDSASELETAIEKIGKRLREADIVNTMPHKLSIPVVKTNMQIPEKPQWLEIIGKALRMIRRQEIGKIVLARKNILTAADPWSPEWIIGKLASIRENAFLFLYQPGAGNTFLGRSPERLFKLSKTSLTIDAIAGTEPRGATAEEDRHYAEALIGSPKEREEQQIVARYVNDKMSHLCSETLTNTDEQVLKLDKVQHLVTRFCGTPRKGLTAFETLQSLHPTPAVGADPPDAAGMISELEPFERGWYAGPIGWMNKHSAEFAVAIRSALLTGLELHIFAGAGIVEQSDPDREWHEIDDKMSNFSFITGAQA